MRPSVRLSALFACALSATVALCAGNEEWTSLGPEGGGIRFLVVDPQEPGGIYAVSDTGRPFKSMDDGVSWKALPFPEFGVNVLAINPQLSSTLYAGTSGGGIFRSTDAGASWEPVNSGLPDRGYVSSLALDDESPSTLYAIIHWNGFGWLLEKSTDAGGSWSEPDAAAPFKSVPARSSCCATLTADPHNPGTLYLGIEEVGIGVGGLYKTTDGGKNWARAQVPDGGWSSLVFDPKNPGIEYAIVCDSAGNGVCTVLKTTDGGADWRPISVGLPGSLRSLTIDPTNTTILYAVIFTNDSPTTAGTFVFKTTDAGASWTMLSSPPLMTWNLVPDPHVPGTLYITTRGGGVLRSRDGGASLTPVNSGLVATSVSALAIDPQSPNTLYAATFYKGSSLAKSEDGGKSWITGGAGLPGVGVNSLAIDFRNPATLYATSVPGGGGVFKSTDGAMSWRAVNEGLPGFPTIGPLALDPQNPNTVYVAAGDGALYKSTDGASSWTQVNTGPGNVELRPAPIWGISIDPRDPANIYLLARHSKLPVFKSKDGGKNFSPAISGLPLNSVGPMAIDPQNPRTLYVWAPSYENGELVPGENVLFQSTDGAGSWSPLKPGLPVDVFVTKLSIDPQQPSTLYAASTRGVWKSRDSGKNWNSVNVGLTTLLVPQLAIDPQHSRRVFAGSFGGGVFTITFDADTGPSTSPASPGLN